MVHSAAQLVANPIEGPENKKHQRRGRGDWQAYSGHGGPISICQRATSNCRHLRVGYYKTGSEPENRSPGEGTCNDTGNRNRVRSPSSPLVSLQPAKHADIYDTDWCRPCMGRQRADAVVERGSVCQGTSNMGHTVATTRYQVARTLVVSTCPFCSWTKGTSSRSLRPEVQ